MTSFDGRVAPQPARRPRYQRCSEPKAEQHDGRGVTLPYNGGSGTSFSRNYHHLQAAAKLDVRPEPTFVVI
jgi:hypothetical protein